MSLNLGYNNLRNEGVIKLLHALMANQYIKELILNETRISEKSVEVIGSFLTLTPIDTLDFKKIT